MSEAPEPATSPDSDRPDICSYTDYRAFVRAMVSHLRVVEPGFSFRSFAKRAGFASPNYLKLVADGMRNLAPESADKFARGLALTKREQDIFRLLTLIANARTDDERNTLFQRLRERVVAGELTRLRDDQFAVYDVWWALVVRDMVQLPDFELDARWIARRLRPRLRRAQAQRAIDLLLRLGLIVREPDGRVRASERTVSSGPDVQSLAVRNYHRSVLELAAHSLDEVPKEERNITSVTALLSRSEYDEVVAEIGRLRRRILQISDARPAGADREVHQIVFALLPVTQPLRERRAGERDDDDEPGDNPDDDGTSGDRGDEREDQVQGGRGE